VAESPEVFCWCQGYGRSFDCASCIEPQDASLRMTVLGRDDGSIAGDGCIWGVPVRASVFVSSARYFTLDEDVVFRERSHQGGLSGLLFIHAHSVANSIFCGVDGKRHVFDLLRHGAGGGGAFWAAPSARDQ